MNALNVLAPVDAIEASLSQPELERHPTNEGSVSFFRGRLASLTLGGPVAAPGRALEVARDFLGAHPKAAFFYVGTSQLRELAPLRLNTVPIGEDFVLDLPTVEWSPSILSAHRKAVKAGLTLTELSRSELTKLEPEMREIQAAYLAKQEVKCEMRFLTRLCEFAAERVGRTFGLFFKGALLGFAVLDPYTTASGAPAAMLNLFRVGPTKLWGVYFAVVKLLAEKLAAEGLKALSLGFLPLSFSPDHPPASKQLALFRELAKRSPYLKGLRHLKESFPARRETRWLLTPRTLLIRDFVTLFEAMGVYRKPSGATTR